MKKATVAVKKEFKACWRFASLRWGFIASSVVSAITALIMAWPDSMLYLWGAMPAEVKALIPENLLPLIGAIIFVLSALNRILKQRAVNDEKQRIDTSEQAG